MTAWHDLSIIVALSFVSLFISRFTRIQIACVYLVLGLVFSKVLNLNQDIWPLFASFGASLVAFLAGNEFDKEYFVKSKKKLVFFSIIGFVSPLIFIFSILYYWAAWSLNASLIASIALSETSIAMVYAVITSRNYGEVGKFVFCALHLTDLIVLFAITFLFMEYNPVNLLIFSILNLIPYVIVVWLKSTKKLDNIMENYGPSLFMLMIVLAGLSTKYINALPVLPVFLLGLYSSSLTRKNPIPKIAIRNFGFLFLIPIYFLRAGSLVDWDILVGGLAFIAAIVIIKIISKSLPLYIISRNYGFGKNQAKFICSLMSTGLTLGVFIAVHAFETNLLTRNQYSLLLPIILLTAILPTIAAERLFYPFEENKDVEQTLAEIKTDTC